MIKAILCLRRTELWAPQFWKALLQASWATETKLSLRVGEDGPQFAPDPYAVSFFVFLLRFLAVLFRLMEDWFSLSGSSLSELRSTSSVPLKSAWRVFFELLFVWWCFLEFVFKGSSLFDGYFLLRLVLWLLRSGALVL